MMKNDIQVITKKAKGNKCSVCWKIKEKKMSKRNCNLNLNDKC